MEGVEQIPTHWEANSISQDLALEARHQASLQASLQWLSGSSSSLQLPKGCELGDVGEAMLHKWYLPGPNKI